MALAIGLGIGLAFAQSTSDGGSVTNYLLANDATVLIDGSGNRLTNG